MITTIKDYLPIIYEKYPTVPKQDIDRIIKYGWRMFYYYNLRGCDTIINSNTRGLWLYCGELTRNSLKHFQYYKRMLRRKLRVLYSKFNKGWDGYYYIGLTEEEYTLLYGNKRGRKRKNFTFNNKVMLKVFDEAKVFYSWAKCIVKFRYIDIGYSFFKSILKCLDIEIVLIKERPWTFKDILVESGNYELIK